MLTGIKRHYKGQGREVNVMALAGDGMQPWLHRAFFFFFFFFFFFGPGAISLRCRKYSCIIMLVNVCNIWHVPSLQCALLVFGAQPVFCVTCAK